MHTKLPCLALLVACFMILSLTAAFAKTGHVRLVWEPPTTHVDGSPATGPKGYNLYYWQPSWDLPERIDVGNQATYLLTGLDVDQPYHFAVTAYDERGNESAYSNIVSTTIASSSPPSDPGAPTDVNGSADTTEDVIVGTNPDVSPTDGNPDNDGDEAGTVDQQSASLFTITTPQNGNRLTGSAVSVAVLDLPAGATSVLFQVIPAGAETPEVLGEATDAPFLVVWDVVAYEDGEYVLQAIAMSSEDIPITAASITVSVSNASSDEADIIEDSGIKIEAIDKDKDRVVVTADGVIVEIPAGTFATDDRIVISVVDEMDAPGMLPGDSNGVMFDIATESGQHIFGTDITIRIPYVDEDQDGVIDGTNTAETTLAIWFFDGVDWRQLPDTDVLQDDNVVVGWTDHFTEFATFSSPAAADHPGDTTLSTQNESRGGGGSSSCFIATAAYGSPLAPQVQTLREFRDAYLLTNSVGRWFVAQYYQFSPPLADFIARHNHVRACVRVGLTPFVWAGHFMMQSTGAQKLGIPVIMLLFCVSMAGVLRCLIRTYRFMRRRAIGSSRPDSHPPERCV